MNQCPHCIGGQLSIDYDTLGRWDEVCIQCGYRREMNPNDSRIPKDKAIRKACEIECHLQSAVIFQGSVPKNPRYGRIANSDELKWHQ